MRETGGREKGIGNREKGNEGTGSREQGKGERVNREQGTGNREQGTGNRNGRSLSLAESQTEGVHPWDIEM